MAKDNTITTATIRAPALAPSSVLWYAIDDKDLPHYTRREARTIDAILNSRDGYTVFQYDDHVIRFRAPYSLERYTKVKEWNRGYLVVDAKYKHNSQDEEEYIDLIPILKDLYIEPDTFLAPIKGVKIRYD